MWTNCVCRMQKIYKYFENDLFSKDVINSTRNKYNPFHVVTTPSTYVLSILWVYKEPILSKIM